MINFSSPFSWFILLYIGIALVITIYVWLTLKSKKKAPSNFLQKGKSGEPGVCPICCTILRKHEQLKTKVYPSANGNWPCSIYGCPHCYPVAENNAERFCPVCKAPVAADSYLIARLFDRGEFGRHVRVLGCTQCRIG